MVFARAIAWEGNHVRLILLPNNSKSLSKEVAAKISACLRVGCRCLLDENVRDYRRQSTFNSFAQLADECGSVNDGRLVCVV